MRTPITLALCLSLITPFLLCCTDDHPGRSASEADQSPDDGPAGANAMAGGADDIADHGAEATCPELSIEAQARAHMPDADSIDDNDLEHLHRVVEVVFGRYIDGELPVLGGVVRATDNRAGVDQGAEDGSVETTEGLATIYARENFEGVETIRLTALDPQTGQRIWLTQSADAPGQTKVSMVEPCASRAAAHYTCRSCAPELSSLLDGSVTRFDVDLVATGIWGAGGGDVEVEVALSLEVIAPGSLTGETLVALNTDDCQDLHHVTSALVEEGDYYVGALELWDSGDAGLDTRCSGYEYCEYATTFGVEMFIHRDDTIDRGLRAVTPLMSEVCCTEPWDVDIHGAGLPSPKCIE